MKHFGVYFCSSSSIIGKIQDSRHDCLECETQQNPANTWNLPGNSGAELCGKGRKLEMHTQSKAIRRALASLVQCRASILMAITGHELHICEQEKKMGSFVRKLLSFLLFLVFSLWISNHPLAILNKLFTLQTLSNVHVFSVSNVPFLSKVYLRRGSYILNCCCLFRTTRLVGDYKELFIIFNKYNNYYMTLLISKKIYSSTFRLQNIHKPFEGLLGSAVGRCLKALEELIRMVAQVLSKVITRPVIYLTRIQN